MFRNYIKIAWRSLKTSRLFSIINIVGLSIGLAITLLLSLFVVHEHSFNNMYVNKDSIYRVLLNTTKNDFETWTKVPSIIAQELKENIPEIVESGRIFHHKFGKPASVKVQGNLFIEDKLFWCDASIFKMFNIEILNGIGNLNSPNTILLSASTAKRYFGDENPLGKSISIDNANTFEVKGIYKDFASNSSLDFNVIAPFMMQYAAKNPSWDNASFETFVMLNSKASKIDNVKNKIQSILDANLEKKDQWYNFSLQPLKDIHLYSSTYSGSYITNNGDINQIRNLTALAILILIIASINYMNLTTARSQKRTTDIGINKTLGASVKNIILRFYVETGLITAISMFLGGLLSIVILPVFNKLSGTELNISTIFSIKIIGFIALIWLIATLISGSYPALYLSRFSPKAILKPSAQKRSVSSTIRKALVVIQFSMSVVLILGVIVIHNQLEFIQNKNLGYNPEHVIAISTSGVRGSNKSTSLINAFKKLPNVLVVSRSQGYPGMDVSGRSLVKPFSEQSISVQTNRSEHDIADVLQLKLLSGKLLPRNKQKTDTLVEVVLNKKAIDFLGYSPKEAIGKKVDMQLGNNAYIRGVVDDFNFTSLHSPIGAYAFHNSPRESKSYLLVRFKNEKVSETISNFQTTSKEVVPNSVFEYTFLDKKLELLYGKEQRTANIALLFSMLAVFVACLGLFGLVAYTVEQRNKEIGVRKILGASVASIVKLLSTDFVKLVVIALIIAFPFAYYIMNIWLQQFAYRTTISWYSFLFTGLFALCVAIFTVSFQTIKAAISNPVNSLRSE